MKYFQLNKLFLVLCIMIESPITWAMDGPSFQYFEKDIDFWGNKTGAPKASPQQRVEPGKKPEGEASGAQAQEKFNWSKVMDPKNKEFFKEGDYTPPEPFMEIVRNPSDANLKLWFSYIDKKNQLSDRLQARMREYVEKNSVKLGSPGVAIAQAKIQTLPRIPDDAKRFRFRMYFDSHCPHCKRMFGTLTELQSKGYYVEAVQVDRDPKGLEGLPMPVTRASAQELNAKDIKSVPLLLVGDLKQKAVYRITGYQTVASIFQTIARGASQEGAGMK